MINLTLPNIIAIAIILVIFIWRIKASAKNGFAKEISNLVSTIVAFISFKLLAEAIFAFTEHRFGRIAYVVAMIALVILIYRLVKLILGALKLFSKLPVVNLLDKLLGIGAGFIESVLLIMLILDLIKDLVGMA